MIGAQMSVENLGKMLQKEKWYLQNNVSAVLAFSALGARVCYAANLTLTDKRMNAEMFPYLDKLRKMKHYSVFAHTPVVIKVSAKAYVSYGLNNLFKAYYDFGAQKLYLNLRHIVEAMPDVEIPTLIGFLHGNGTYELPPAPIGIRELKRATVDNVTAWGQDNWLVFLIRGVDRATTHQLVRHQSLNFNQQSQRYVKVDVDAVPSYIISGIYEKYPDVSVPFEIPFSTYAMLVKKGMRKEDARLILPNATASNIVVSGYRDDFDAFFKARTHSSAQWMIRHIASNMKQAMEALK